MTRYFLNKNLFFGNFLFLFSLKNFSPLKNGYSRTKFFFDHFNRQKNFSPFISFLVRQNTVNACL